jgi:hypothetical protein
MNHAGSNQQNMLKRIKIVLLIIGTTQFLNAQPIAQWAKGFGGLYSDGVTQIVNDDAGNTYITGVYSDTLDMDPGLGVFNIYPYTLSVPDGFVLKLDPNGNFLWVKTFGGNLYDGPGGIAVDANQHVYLGYLFNGTVDLDPGAGVFSATSAGDEDMAVIRLDQNGNFLWAKIIGGVYSQQPTGITLDYDDNILLTGRYLGTVDFDPGAATNNLSTSSVLFTSFVLKLTNAGNFIWARSLGSSGSTEISIGIAVDTNNNVYTAGTFNSNSDFDPGAATFTLTPNGVTDCYVSKLTENGDFSWALSFGSTTSDYPKGIKVSNTNSVYITGSFRTTVDFNPGAGTNNMTVIGAEDGYILKLSDMGNYVWAKQIGGSGVNVNSNSIAVDQIGAAYITGIFNGTVDFDPNGGIQNLSAIAGAENAFISKLDVNGNYVWAKVFGGTNAEYGTSISIKNNAVFVGGSSFSPLMQVDAFSLVGQGATDIFIAKFLQPCLPSNSSQTVIHCGSYQWLANSQIYNSSGVYTAVIPNASGCDSTITLNLTINNSNTATQNITACNTYTWPVNGNTYTNSITTTHPLTNVHGCDSVVTLNLTIHNSNAATQNITACNSYTWPVNGITYTNSTTATHTLTNVHGCDSVVTLNLTIHNSNTATQNITACNTYTWPVNGNTYTNSTSATHTLTNVHGCDSVVSLNLTIHNSNAATQNITACNTYTWPVNGTTYTNSTTATHTLTNVHGCDSVVTLNLIIHNSNAATQNITACNTYTWPVNGTTYTNSTTATHTLTNSFGCDSVISLNLTIQAIDLTVIQTGTTLTANASTALYQWIDCNNGNAILPGETNQVFTANVNGAYAVIVTQNDCTDTSDCFIINNVGLDSDDNQGISIFPNPTSDFIQIIFNQQSGPVTVEILSISGQLVHAGTVAIGHTIQLDVSSYVPGIYYVHIIEQNMGSKNFKIIKK